jgi:hypothetical protein
VGLGQGENDALSEQGASVPLVGTSVGAGRDRYNPFGRNEVGIMGLSLRSSKDNPSKGTVDVSPYTLADLQAQGRTPPPTTKMGQGGIPSNDVPQETFRGRDDVEVLICAYPWPQGCDYWIGIARCESTLGQDPNAYADWNPYVGLFQIWIGHNYERGWLEDDANNVLAAWELSHEGTRTSPWPYCQW